MANIINHHGNVEEVSAPAFSKAPWSAVIPLSEDYAPFVLTSDGGDPFDAATLEGGNAACIANARLIAAAPEMFAALLEACLALETPARCVFNDNGDHTITNTVLAPDVYSACYYASRTVKEALAKARGEHD